MEMLCFRLPGHGDKTLRHMDSLRSRQHFCDITIVASNNQTFRGHKVVLAACSPFLRDQFLLNPSPKLQVSMLYSASVVCDLLLSCYTGMLQFNPEEIVNYLTAASYLQMEHIVERCRGALKKYVQLKNPSAKLTSEETSPKPLFAGGERPVASPPAFLSMDTESAEGRSFLENGSDLSAQDGGHHRGESPALDEPYIKVNASDEEDEPKREDGGVYAVYVSEEEPTTRDGDAETGAAPDGLQDAAFYPETGRVVLGGGDGGSEYEMDLSAAGLSVDDLRLALRRKDAKVGRGRGAAGKGRGHKKKKWPQEKRLPGIAHHPEMWYMAGAGGAFGLDFTQEALKSGGFVSLDLPQVDFAQAEKAATAAAANAVSQFSLEESSGCGAGEGGSGLGGIGAKEGGGGGGDESVAVVGSTSSASGPLICEHCGMTFPSVHALASHTRAMHLLYTCTYCGKHFFHASSFTRHMAVHRVAGKSHQCPLCYKTFTQKSTLIDHMNLHSGERPHRCAYCHARFAHKPALRRHLKEQHGKTTGQNSLHEQEERQRARDTAAAGAAAGGMVRQEEQECPVTEQGS